MNIIKQICFNFQKVTAAALCILMMVCALFFIAFGCGTSNSAPDGNDGVQASLAGTAWKLVGIVGAETANNPTGALRELNPVDCEDCYTLWFDTDYTGTGIAIGSRFKLNLSNLNPYINMEDIMYCELYDKDGEAYCDYDLFRRAIRTTGSYSVSDDVLTLFQHRRGQTDEDLISTHLLFKRIDRAPATLRGTTWHLQGIVDVQTGEAAKPESINALDHVIRFLGDNTIQFRSLDSILRQLWSLVLDNGLVVWKSFEDDRDSQFFAEALWLEIGGKFTGDNYLFEYGQVFAKSYELTQDELKLFFVYQEKNYYLLYTLAYQ